MTKRISRRDWSKLSLAGLAGMMMPPIFMSCKTLSAGRPDTPGQPQSGTTGVIIGVHTYSFRDRNLAEAITAMKSIGINSCELFSQHLEPANFTRIANPTPAEWRKQKDALKQWRATVSMQEIMPVRAMFEKAGIRIQAYNDTFLPHDGDEAFEQVFKIAKALGTDTITTSATVDVMKRVDQFAQKYRIKVAMHNHANLQDPNQIATPESFERGMAGNSELIRINLDIGHFTAANFDAVDFMKKYYDKIDCIHIKDRKKNDGPNVPLGEGDTPIAEVLRLIRDHQWPIPANIEYEYKGGDTVAEVKKCFDYCHNILLQSKT